MRENEKRLRRRRRCSSAEVLRFRRCWRNLADVRWRRSVILDGRRRFGSEAVWRSGPRGSGLGRERARNKDGALFRIFGRNCVQRWRTESAATSCAAGHKSALMGTVLDFFLATRFLRNAVSSPPRCAQRVEAGARGATTLRTTDCAMLRPFS